MSDIVYFNGQWLPLEQAHVSVCDRGFLFADGVYEVVRYYNGKPHAMDRHVRRLDFSLSELRITLPDDAAPFDRLSDEAVKRNNLRDADVYWQVTRGAAPRLHAFPVPPVKPTILVMALPEPPLADHDEPTALTAITHPDIRWTQCAIKSISLLGNVLARQAAVDAGCNEAVMLRGDIVTEGTSRSLFIADGGALVTHPLDGTILGSITRELAIELAGELGIPVHEEKFTIDRLRQADEVITVGTSTEVAAVVSVDDQPIADGQAGPMTRQLCAAYRAMVRAECEIR